MKPNKLNSAGSKIKFGSIFPALVLTGALLFSPRWGVQPCAAGIGFPTATTNEETMSAAVFQLVVDPAFTNLFYPVGSSTFYPGYSPAGGVLTSPMLFQYPTWIGTSVSHVRNTNSPSYFPVTVGDATASPNPPAATIANYAQFAFIPPPFNTAPSGVAGVGVDEIFTEIEDLDMVGISSGSTGQSNSTACTDPRMPAEPPSGMVAVAAGPLAIPGLPQNLRSIGIVQQITPGGGAASDFPAQSFYDMFVQVTLPMVPGNGTVNFPTPADQAVLYNDASDPLIVSNLFITNLPPTVAYTHSAVSTAVPVKFLTSNPPYWTAGEVLGYLTLAGHGIFSNATTVTVCQRVTDPGGLLDLTLGPVGSPLAGAPVPWLLPTNSFPPVGYNSFENTFVDSTTLNTNVLDDTVSFTVGTKLVYLRDLSLVPGNAAALPTAGNSQAYTSPSAAVSFQVSQNGVDFSPAAFSGSCTIEVYNTNGVSGNTTTYSMQLTQLTASGGAGSYYLRISPTQPTLGIHTVAPDPRGYRVSSIFNAFLELSPDDVNWYPANRSMRLEASMPAAAPNSIYVSTIGKNTVLQWQNSFTLQSTTNLSVPFADVPGPVTVGPYTNTLAASARFFRLRQ